MYRGSGVCKIPRRNRNIRMSRQGSVGMGLHSKAHTCLRGVSSKNKGGHYEVKTISLCNMFGEAQHIYSRRSTIVWMSILYILATMSQLRLVCLPKSSDRTNMQHVFRNLMLRCLVAGLVRGYASLSRCNSILNFLGRHCAQRLAM